VVSITVTCFPNSDVLNSGTLVGSATYYGALAQDPHDGDTTRIRTVNGGTNICGVDWSPVPANATPQSVTVRWTEAGTSSDVSLGQAGLWDGTQSYFGTQRTEPPHGYAIFEEAFPVNPQTGDPWTRAALVLFQLQHDMVMCPLELGYPRLTQLVAVVTYDILNIHDEASAESLASGASVSGGAIAGKPASMGARATTISLAPSGSGEASALHAVPVGQGPSAIPVRLSQAASVASIAGCTATVVSLAPVGTPSALTPSGIPSALNPDRGDAA
jgi:hypothetical protein